MNYARGQLDLPLLDMSMAQFCSPAFIIIIIISSSSSSSSRSSRCGGWS
jgi:hypothetical protein